MTPGFVVDASAFAAACLFIFGLRRMSSPVTARSGIVIAGYGMLVAVLASFLYGFEVSAEALSHLRTNILLGMTALVIGTAWAWWQGKRVAITAMPQMVALFNGMGAGAAAGIGAAELLGGKTSSSEHLLITVFGAVIGSVSLSGSLIAWAKLDGRIKTTWRFKGQRLLNGFVLAITLIVGIYIALGASEYADSGLTAAFFGGALLFGVLMTLPIGGADMPVVISLYNAFTGLAVGAEGFVLQNPALMIAGMVVGSAGALLTILMAKAMNRSIANVLFSRFGASEQSQSRSVNGRLKPVEAGDAALSMHYARKVIIVPGYGLAVAQAQHKLWEFVKLLQAAGVDVKFAVHPVAGRMPGHMDVLLAEAGVPYDLMFDLDEINAEFSSTDVALVIGANDVVNPAARTDKASPIYGMPILNADQAHQVYVIKRGQGKGYSGVENELFYADNCYMIYGDAEAVLVKMLQAIKDLGLDAAA